MNITTCKAIYQCCLAVFLVLPTMHPATAQGYPDRPIRVIVPYGPGGMTDIAARSIAPFLGQALKQSVFVENRPGGSTIIGTEAVVKARPDGYTLLVISGTALTANPVLFKKMPYDAAKELIPINFIGAVPLVLAVHPSLPVNSATEFIALAKSKTNSLNYSSAGNGSGNHLFAELFMHSAGIDAQHIPYKSGSEMLFALVGGQVSFAISALVVASPVIKSGGIKVLAVTSQRRNANLPGVPTLDESGLRGFNVTEWVGIFAPAGTPPDVIERISTATGMALQNAELVAKFKALGVEVNSGDGKELARVVNSDIARWAQLAQEVKFESQ